MPINASPHYEKAEAEYLAAQTTEQKIRCLKKMISLAPKHKGSENLLKQLKTRLKKLKYAHEKESKKSGATQKGIKKSDMQAVIVGHTNTGKSTLISKLTNARPEIATYNFTTTIPIVGTLKYQGVNIQIIEIPAPESDFYDKGLVHTADTILILVNNLVQIKNLQPLLEDSRAKKITIYNLQKNEDERKIAETLKSKKYNFITVDLNSNKNYEELEILKEKIFQSFGKIRVFTKEPGKKPDKTKPLVLGKDSTVEQAAEKILHGFSKKVKEAFITGPSSKFPNQKVGLKHKLKDLDVVEFRVK